MLEVRHDVFHQGDYVETFRGRNCAPPLGATDDLRMKKRKALDKKKCEDAKSKSQSKRMLEKEMLRETEHEPQPDLEEPNDNDTVEHNEVPEELIVQVKHTALEGLESARR